MPRRNKADSSITYTHFNTCRLKAKGEREKGQEKTFNRSADAHGETLNLSPAETLRVACLSAGVHLFPKLNSDLKILNRAVLIQIFINSKKTQASCLSLSQNLYRLI
ncbi:hypothetical protein FDUTEX481_09189 [Tolypothrix sp. PCC 7601]|nr:hypothetical protein FDUTEX481_09189 [Tolypothrix sp. PCC 7601]